MLDVVEREFNDRFGIGANNPPSPIQIAQETFADVSRWLSNNPVIETEEIALEAAALIKRAEGSLREIESERDSKVRPLNEQVNAINAEYKSYHNADKKSKNVGSLDKIFSILTGRVGAFMKAEEDRRWREAEAKRLAALEAERIARETEEKEREALENASLGEVGIDVAAVTQEADTAFRDFEKAFRRATIAEKNAPVRLSGGYGRVMTLKNKETLIVTDAAAAIAVVGLTDGIRDAILTAARAYRKLNNNTLPEGVKAETGRDL
jgi:hypothetical protein